MLTCTPRIVSTRPTERKDTGARFTLRSRRRLEGPPRTRASVIPTNSWLRSAARAGAVAVVAVCAVVGTRFLIDLETPRAPASSQAARTGNLGETGRLSAIDTGVETAASDASLTPLDLSAGTGNVDERAQAITVDRALVESGRAQVYGTQYKCEKGDLVPSTPIEAPDEVDTLRAYIGFPPLDEAVAEASEQNDRCPDAGS